MSVVNFAIKIENASRKPEGVLEVLVLHALWRSIACSESGHRAFMMNPSALDVTT